MDRIYVQTNDAKRNEVVAFDRNADGTLTAIGHFETGGRGSGTPHLASQSSIVVSGDRLLVANAGSDELSLFGVTAAGLDLVSRVPSGGSHPTSVAVHGELAYVLNNWRRHREDQFAFAEGLGADPFSTAPSFTSWRSRVETEWPASYEPLPAAEPKTWLLREGWKMYGLIDPGEVPGDKP